MLLLPKLKLAFNIDVTYIRMVVYVAATEISMGVQFVLPTLKWAFVCAAATYISMGVYVDVTYISTRVYVDVTYIRMGVYVADI